MNKTKQALKLMDDSPGRTQQSVADAVGLNQSAVSRALKRRRETIGRRCPVCDQVLPYLKHVIKD